MIKQLKELNANKGLSALRNLTVLYMYEKVTIT